MKNLVAQYITQADAQQIISTVKKVEKKTSAEIVPMIVNASFHYPLASVYAAVTLSLPVALVLTHYIAPLFYYSRDNMWIFIALFSLLFLLLKGTIARNIFLLRSAVLQGFSVKSDNNSITLRVFPLVYINRKINSTHNAVSE